MLLVLPGGNALSDFRRTKLEARLRAIEPEATQVRARWLVVAQLSRSLSDDERSALDQLLDDGSPPWTSTGGGVEVLIGPRPGTISPWSTKATDIAHSAGLEAVQRLERVRLFVIGGHAEPDAFHELHDRMTEAVLGDVAELFIDARPAPGRQIPVLAHGAAALHEADRLLGMALSEDEVAYLVRTYKRMGRDPTDTELMMFAQANSEHCRHKIFNARWTLDGQEQDLSLFKMIRHTHAEHPGRVVSAYKDNAAVARLGTVQRFHPEPSTHVYGPRETELGLLMKVETHNHPTAISPDPGAATGSGGEIRDEGATGRGGKPKAALVGFMVSDLHLPGAVRPWELDASKPDRIASARQIMLEGPIGAARYNNEFGRPALHGFFRSFHLPVDGPSGPERRGYHKPIMLAGGMGHVEMSHVEKLPIPPGASLIVLGGPSMPIGLGGGAASSMASGQSSEDLDFASVQRANPEMERRCQEVIDTCWALGDDNPILSIHDVGAGGLSNAMPELVNDHGRGATLDLRAIPSDDAGMSPLAIWCNEAQERYVLAVSAEELPRFESICQRERCPYAVLGKATEAEHLRLADAHMGEDPVDLDLAVLFGNPPSMHRVVEHAPVERVPFDPSRPLDEALDRVLRLPTVADKTFLVTIGDRSITGQVVRDQMVGPWQVPVADVAVTVSDHEGYAGEAMATGERSPVALLSGPASARLAVGEALLNLAAAPVEQLSDVVFSANWMVPAGHEGEDANLYDTVQALAMELCPALGICIPVGKDSMSMRTRWEQGGQAEQVTSPTTVVITGFAAVPDVRRTLTPQLETDGMTDLVLVDLGNGKDRLGGSALAQVYGELGAEPADLDDPQHLAGLFAAVQELNREGLLLAYHDRSDGGLVVTLLEMAFAARCGLRIDLPTGRDPIRALFSEELGCVLQTRVADRARVAAVLDRHGLVGLHDVVGHPSGEGTVQVRQDGKLLLDARHVDLRRTWSEVSYRMQALRDDPDCALQAYDALLDVTLPPMHPRVSFDAHADIAADDPRITIGKRPRVAILREQGVNGHVEMAAAFHAAGFEPIDVHMSDLARGRQTLDDMAGLAACGGFSFGDVLGAGGGWAGSILHNPRMRDQFAAFFARPDTFTLGVCNGCQMLSLLGDLVPGAEGWPRFVGNQSEQFEARQSMVAIQKSPSLLFEGMQGSHLPIAVAHGEGRVQWRDLDHQARARVAAVYVDPRGQATEQYPYNPNGSAGGVTALTTDDGRATILMPHPERVFRAVTHSWAPKGWAGDGPWLRMFRNARVAVG